jgi:hypothetical protein
MKKISPLRKLGDEDKYILGESEAKTVADEPHHNTTEFSLVKSPASYNLPKVVTDESYHNPSEFSLVKSPVSYNLPYAPTEAAGQIKHDVHIDGQNHWDPGFDNDDYHMCAVSEGNTHGDKPLTYNNEIAEMLGEAPTDAQIK